MSKDTGGPAFPTGTAYQGMTLRDYFAAKAMQGIVSVLNRGIRPTDMEAVCKDAYAIADAMLKARGEK
jgi:hypothetical protein